MVVGKTAGCNAVHRCASLVLPRFFSLDTVRSRAREESRLTHWSGLSQETCVAMCELSRMLVCGMAWQDALAAFFARHNNDESPIVVTIRQLRTALALPASSESEATLTKGGFAPAVLGFAG